MKIDRIETINLRFEYANGFTYAGGKCTGRLTSLVLVHGDGGQVGIGTAYSHPALVHMIVQQQLAPLLVGEDPTEVERIWDRMYRVTRWYGRKGVAMSALGAIDTACWDLRGKAQGKPVWSLFGGRQPRCPAYASALLWKEPPDLAEEAARLIARGFRRVKMRLGRGPDRDRAAVNAVRQAIGSDCDLMCDGSMRYSPGEARSLGEYLAAQRVFWFEEPFQPEDLDAYAAFRGTVDVPLAAGENEFGFQGFRELIRTRAVDIVQPDACRCGGISEVKRVADLAHAAGLRVATHSWSDAVAIVANAHVVSAVPNGLTVEVDQTGNPFVDELLEEPLSISDGVLALSDRPGLGIELNRTVVERYRMADPLTIPDGSYSDMVFGRQYWHD
ncbi:MAG: mandelate racemase/muconate lactonizing enzyme family protein [Planctomycetales bacterium]